MILISYASVMAAITVLGLLVRCGISLRQKQIRWMREFQLLLVYICVIVVVRFTFFPFSKVDGQVQPLVLIPANILRPKINLVPFVHLFDYPVFREALRNLIGNTTMFIPLGIVWPSVFRQLDTHKKVILSGVLTSLAIEILQLPFERVTDIDDLILNSLGFLAGYVIYLLVKKMKRK